MYGLLSPRLDRAAIKIVVPEVAPPHEVMGRVIVQESESLRSLAPNHKYAVNVGVARAGEAITYETCRDSVGVGETQPSMKPGIDNVGTSAMHTQRSARWPRQERHLISSQWTASTRPERL